MKSTGLTRRKMIITNSGECKFLFLIVNATILVILSTRQRVSSASVATSADLKQPQHQSQVVVTADTIEAGPGSSQRPMGKPTSERNNSRQQHTTSATTSASSSSTSTSTPSQSAKLTSPNSQALETNALVYLQRYGYMQPPPVGAETSNNLISEESFSQAIAEFQRFAGLAETGQVDNQTLNMMRMPRCGNTDKTNGPTTIHKSGQLVSRSWMVQAQSGRTDSSASSWSALKRRRKRYALQGSKWRRQELTYRISQYPTKFAGRRHEVDSQIEKAFGIWSQVAPIDFIVKKEGRVHIDIRFASGDHGDGDAFDGPGNTLAHAYFPQYGGDAHFDDQEYWTVDSYAGTNIFQVAAHELGHSLGLGHSNVREALMAPFYQKYKPNFKLHIDDVLAIQALYGEKAFLPEVPADHTSTQRPPTTSTVSPTTTTTTSTTTTTTTTARPSSTIAFGARSPPIYRGNKRPPAGARNDDEPLPSPSEPNNDENANPDLSSNGINGFGSASGGSDGGSTVDEPTFAGNSPPADLCLDSTIDAITRTEDGNSYVFKGDHYWLLTNEGLARGYPRRVATDWDGLPGQLDAALTWADGKTFFFKGNKYWRFRNRRRDLGYPKLISAGFAGIPDDIDAAFVWSGNGRTYFFKGADYWRFDSKAEPPVSSEYPRSIKVWLGVPAHINAAFKWDNNVTYFFKGNQYYRFNDREFKVESRGRPPFPRQTSEWWFGCVSSNLAQRALPSARLPPIGQINTQQLTQQNGPTRTARLHPNPNQRTSVAALQLMPPSFSNQDQADWSFLAGLNADQTRSMGTHISDHHQKPSAPPSSSPASDRNWREEETISESDINRRLVPISSLDGHREPQFVQADHEQSWRRPAPASSSRVDIDHNASTHKTNSQPGSSLNTDGPNYQTSSSATTAILFATHNSLVIGRWIMSVVCATMIMWLGTIGNKHKINLHQSLAR